MSTIALPGAGSGRSGRGLRAAAWSAVVGLVLLLLLVAVLGGAPQTCPVGVAGGGSTDLTDGQGGDKAIPAAAADTYRQVAATSGVPAAVLAAVGYIESRHGRDPSTSTAGAQGPMQFLPSTWSALRCQGSIQAFEPAVTCAARYLTELAHEPGAKRPGVDRWQYAACRYNGGCTAGISAEAGYGSSGQVAGELAKQYGYQPGGDIPTLSGAIAATSSDCGGGASGGAGSAGDVAAAAAPFMGKSWSASVSAGLDPLGWASGTPWCMIFAQNILKRLGIERPDPRNAHSSAPYFWSQQGWGRALQSPEHPASASSLQLQPGDLVMYGPPGMGSAHINVVSKVDDRGVITVGGNQSCANGNGVCERGPMHLVGAGRSLRWNAFDTRPIWAIVRPPAPKGQAA